MDMDTSRIGSEDSTKNIKLLFADISNNMESAN